MVIIRAALAGGSNVNDHPRAWWGDGWLEAVRGEATVYGGHMTVGSGVGKKDGGDAAQQQQQEPVKRVEDTTQPGLPLGEEEDETPTDEHAALGEVEESTDEHAVVPG